MARLLVDLLWRDHPAAPRRGSRGPQAQVATGTVVERAVGLADAGGLDAVTVRALGDAVGISPMSVYTHVNSRDDLLVLMADHVHGQHPRPSFGRASWRTRVRRVADSNRELLRAHAWLLATDDPRTALGPGTIAKYDHELHALDGTGLGHLDRDAALTLVVDLARSHAAAVAGGRVPDGFEDLWADSAGRLTTYLGEAYPLAQEIGRAAGESMGGPYDPDRAWEFGLARVVAGLADLVEG